MRTEQDVHAEHEARFAEWYTDYTFLVIIRPAGT
jgi:hypothetical protein